MGAASPVGPNVSTCVPCRHGKSCGTSPSILPRSLAASNIRMQRFSRYSDRRRSPKRSGSLTREDPIHVSAQGSHADDYEHNKQEVLNRTKYGHRHDSDLAFRASDGVTAVPI